MDNCPCGSEKDYKDCCDVYHSGAKKPESAELLMRARYSAFVKNKVEFIGESHAPGTEDFDLVEAKQWAQTSSWKGLEIVKCTQGLAENQTGTVEFKALYSDKDGKDYLHHEISTFKKLEDTWYYNEGQIVGTGPITRAAPKVGRNEPCPCNSGKKFKKCCGA